MKIRSITCFLSAVDDRALDTAGALAGAARQTLEQAGYEVQTMRLATLPFPQWVKPEDLPARARELENAAAMRGFRYLSLGPADPALPAAYQAIPAAIAATQDVFFSGRMTANGRLYLPAVRACAAVIHQAATITPNGFANLRFAALANTPAGGPFFPAAYHQGDTPALAIAVESADLAVEAFTNAPDLETARQTLAHAIEYHSFTISGIGGMLAHAANALYHGLDFSLAPFPEQDRSLGEAFERLGLPAIGLHGSLAAAALIADTIDRARFVRTGFSGLMMPVLEDATLARRAAEGTLTVMDLLLYSAVCGAGLDTVPLPGETTPEELYALLLDVAALALRLDKPLTARLMPVPGKKAGEPTEFDFAFFAPSRVMGLRAAPLTGLFASEADFSLSPRWRGV